MEKKAKPDNNNIGNAGEYFIASILSSRVKLTSGNFDDTTQSALCASVP